VLKLKSSLKSSVIAPGAVAVEIRGGTLHQRQEQQEPITTATFYIAIISLSRGGELNRSSAGHLTKYTRNTILENLRFFLWRRESDSFKCSEIVTQKTGAPESAALTNY